MTLNNKIFFMCFKHKSITYLITLTADFKIMFSYCKSENVSEYKVLVNLARLLQNTKMA